LVALICKLIINVLSESSITEKKIAVNMHKTLVKKLLMGEGDDEPKNFNAMKTNWARNRLWTLVACGKRRRRVYYQRLKKRFGRN
jgi:hypothetical protein